MDDFRTKPMQLNKQTKSPPTDTWKTCYFCAAKTTTITPLRKWMLKFQWMTEWVKYASSSPDPEKNPENPTTLRKLRRGCFKGILSWQPTSGNQVTELVSAQGDGSGRSVTLDISTRVVKMFGWMNKWTNERMVAWMHEWFDEWMKWLKKWMTEWLNKRTNEQIVDWLTECLNESITSWMNDWMAE